jgi:hypothetical protein
MSNEEFEDDLQIASPLPVVLSGLINGLLFCLVWYISFKKGSENAQNQIPLLNIGFLVATVVVAQIFFRRSIATVITYLKLMMSGWAASAVFALVIAIFYRVFFPSIGQIAPPFGFVLLSTSSFGLVISAIVAFFISRKK